MPPWSVEVPALADAHDLTEFAALHHLANAVLIWIAEPLRPHLDDLLACVHGVAGEFRVVQGVCHWFFAIAVLTSANHLGQETSVLMIPGSDHHSVQVLVRENLFGVLIGLWARAEQVMRMCRGAFPIYRPEVADAAEGEVRVCRSG